MLTLLQSAPVERDRFVSHLYQSRREYRRACEAAGKQIERCVISTFQVAESIGFKRDFRKWENSRRLGEGEIGPVSVRDFLHALRTRFLNVLRSGLCVQAAEPTQSPGKSGKQCILDDRYLSYGL
jgi:hypothetical protein